MYDIVIVGGGIVNFKQVARTYAEICTCQNLHGGLKNHRCRNSLKRLVYCDTL